MTEKIELLRALGWSDDLIAQVMKHDANPQFALEIQAPPHFAELEELDLSVANNRGLLATELIVTSSPA